MFSEYENISEAFAYLKIFKVYNLGGPFVAWIGCGPASTLTCSAQHQWWSHKIVMELGSPVSQWCCSIMPGWRVCADDGVDTSTALMRYKVQPAHAIMYGTSHFLMKINDFVLLCESILKVPCVLPAAASSNQGLLHVLIASFSLVLDITCCCVVHHSPRSNRIAHVYKHHVAYMCPSICHLSKYPLTLFAQEWNHLMTHFSEHIPCIKVRMTLLNFFQALPFTHAYNNCNYYKHL